MGFETTTFSLSRFLYANPNCAISSIFSLKLSLHYLDETNSQLQLGEWNDNILIPEMMEMKQTNPDLKVTLAVGGWNTSKALFTSY